MAILLAHLLNYEASAIFELSIWWGRSG